MAGDTHGDGEWAEALTKLAGRHGATVVLQVGDFGYWPRMTTNSGRSHADYYLNRIAVACERYGVTEWIVIDGNHDDHYSLGLLAGAEGPDSLLRLGSHVRYAGRGCRFTIGGAAIGTLGGALSLDAWAEQYGYEFGGTPYRVGWNWFPSIEAPTLHDVKKLADDGPLQVLLTHDSPSGVDLRRFEGFKGVVFAPEVMASCNHVRDLVAAAAVATEAPLLIHGHWHARHSSTLEVGGHVCQVEGLASNSVNNGRDGRSYLFLDIGPLGNRIVVTDGRRKAALPPLTSNETTED